MQYQLHESIGQGCFSTCYKATTGNNETVAMKVMDLEHLSEDKIKYIRKEIHILGKLNHPNIVKFIAVYQINYKIYVATKLYPMGDLWNYFRDHILPESQIITLFLSLIKGVKYLHNLDICHRDIKLANIFLEENLTAILGDFGFATHIPKDGYLTKIIGTPQYTAPEMLAHKYGKSADIWSLGVVLYTILARKFPFKHEDTHTVQELYIHISKINYIPHPFSVRVGKVISGIFVGDPEYRLTLQQIECLLME